MTDVSAQSLERAMVQVQDAAVALGDAISALGQMIVGVDSIRGVQNPSSAYRHQRFDQLQGKRKPSSSGTSQQAIADLRRHTCINNDGGTPNRRCDACDE